MNHRPAEDFWRHENLRLVTQGRWLLKPTRDARPAAAISTDSRTVEPHQAFLALAGDRFDAHDFLPHAAAAGAPLLIIDRPEALTNDIRARHPDTPVLAVNDTAAALTRLAAAYRRSLANTRVIAVTGSNGKTTTTRLIHAALRPRFTGSAPPKSFNNDIGLPLTILAAKPNDQYLLCEVGMNAPGEIAPLARTADPDIAIITSIGQAHIETLGSIEAIAREKASLLSYLRPNGTAITTGDAPTLNPYLKPVPNLITFGDQDHNDLRITDTHHTAPQQPDENPRLNFTINDRARFTIPFPGHHNAHNAAAAVATARRLGLDDDTIRTGLANAEPSPMRFERRTIAGIDIFNDAYNASPESTRAAIRTFAELSRHHRRRVVVLGDMLELGDLAPHAHTDAAHLLLDTVTPLDTLVTVGPMSLFAADAVSDAARQGRTAARVSVHSDMSTEVAHRIAASLKPGDAVLLKGSRKLKLDTVATALEAAAAILNHNR